MVGSSDYYIVTIVTWMNNEKSIFVWKPVRLLKTLYNLKAAEET